MNDFISLLIWLVGFLFITISLIILFALDDKGNEENKPTSWFRTLLSMIGILASIIWLFKYPF